MSTPNSTLRQRAGKEKNKTLVNGDKSEDVLTKAYAEVQKSASKEWDYKVALAIVTMLAFVTRFFGISHPNEVVFDEVHFGKVCRSSICARQHSKSVRSLHPTTYNAPISSTSTLPSESFSSPLLAGSLAMMVISSSTTSENPTLTTMSLMWPFGRCLRSWELLPLWSPS